MQTYFCGPDNTAVFMYDLVDCIDQIDGMITAFVLFECCAGLTIERNDLCQVSI